MAAGTEAMFNGFRFVFKENPVFFFHPLPGRTIQFAEDFQSGIAGQCDFVGSDKLDYLLLSKAIVLQHSVLCVLKLPLRNQT
jgi:hypothetical protein